MIKFENVSLSFDGRSVLKDLSAELQESGIVLITGPSGSGKTSFLRLILGLQPADSGVVHSSDVKISAVFQEDRLLPNLTALENVALVSDKGEAEKRLYALKLSDSLHLYPDELSGGMKRRVAIARALAFGGDVLILDEAFTGIEEPLAREILKSITKEYKEKLIIAVTHRPELFEDYKYSEIKL